MPTLKELSEKNSSHFITRRSHRLDNDGGGSRLAYVKSKRLTYTTEKVWLLWAELEVEEPILDAVSSCLNSRRHPTGLRTFEFYFYLMLLLLSKI